MRERPVKPICVIETPVLDPAVYLLRRQNQAFLEGKSKTPQIGNHTYFILSAAIVLGSIITVVCFALLLVTQGLSDYWLMECFFLFVVATLVTVARMSLDIYRAERTGGVVVVGTVIRTTSALSVVGAPSIEEINIWYRFEFPEGVEQVEHTRSTTLYASSKTTPLPDTPVRVWCTTSGKYYLL